MSNKNNKFKISAPICNEESDLLDGSCSVLDIHVCFEFILKKHREKTDNPSIRMYVIKKQKTELHLKLKQGIISKL